MAADRGLTPPWGRVRYGAAIAVLLGRRELRPGRLAVTAAQAAVITGIVLLLVTRGGIGVGPVVGLGVAFSVYAATSTASQMMGHTKAGSLRRVASHPGLVGWFALGYAGAALPRVWLQCGLLLVLAAALPEVPVGIALFWFCAVAGPLLAVSLAWVLMAVSTLFDDIEAYRTVLSFSTFPVLLGSRAMTQGVQLPGALETVVEWNPVSLLVEQAIATAQDDRWASLVPATVGLCAAAAAIAAITVRAVRAGAARGRYS